MRACAKCLFDIYDVRMGKRGGSSLPRGRNLFGPTLRNVRVASRLCVHVTRRRVWLTA